MADNFGSRTQTVNDEIGSHTWSGESLPPATRCYENRCSSYPTGKLHVARLVAHDESASRIEGQIRRCLLHEPRLRLSAPTMIFRPMGARIDPIELHSPFTQQRPEPRV